MSAINNRCSDYKFMSKKFSSKNNLLAGDVIAIVNAIYSL